jgi:succinate-acetate transporter protein
MGALAATNARPKKMTASLPGLIFAALAVVFLALAVIDFTRHGSPATPARKAWFRIGLIFAAISIYLLFFQRRFQ